MARENLYYSGKISSESIYSISSSETTICKFYSQPFPSGRRQLYTSSPDSRQSTLTLVTLVERSIVGHHVLSRSSKSLPIPTATVNGIRLATNGPKTTTDPQKSLPSLWTVHGIKKGIGFDHVWLRATPHAPIPTQNHSHNHIQFPFSRSAHPSHSHSSLTNLSAAHATMDAAPCSRPSPPAALIPHHSGPSFLCAPNPSFVIVSST